MTKSCAEPGTGPAGWLDVGPCPASGGPCAVEGGGGICGAGFGCEAHAARARLARVARASRVKVSGRTLMAKSPEAGVSGLDLHRPTRPCWFQIPCEFLSF